MHFCVGDDTLQVFVSRSMGVAQASLFRSPAALLTRTSDAAENTGKT